jgi:hypothetical protein
MRMLSKTKKFGLMIGLIFFNQVIIAGDPKPVAAAACFEDCFDDGDLSDDEKKIERLGVTRELTDNLTTTAAARAGMSKCFEVLIRAEAVRLGTLQQSNSNKNDGSPAALSVPHNTPMTPAPDKK